MEDKSTLQGWKPDLGDELDIRQALEKALDYRGDVTFTLQDGSRVEGYLFDRRSEGLPLDQCVARLLPKDGGPAVEVPYLQIAKIEFTGRDTAAGKSFETWMRKYREKKLAGEKGISLEPEKLV
jgi:hypothetical protein